MAINSSSEISLAGIGVLVLAALALGFVAFTSISSECEEEWSCTEWGICSNGTQARACTDNNACGTANNIPDVIQSCEEGCVEQWSCSAWSACVNGMLTRTCNDTESCGTTNNQPPLTMSCNSTCNPEWVCSDWTPCVNNQQHRTCTDLNVCGTNSGKPVETQSCTGSLEQDVRIIRDEWGVAHVFSPSDEGAFYGMGYASAEDRMFQMEYIRLYMYGRLSELIGKKNCIDEGCPDSVSQDVVLRHLQFYSYAEKRYGELDAETRTFLDAYAAGVNQYLADKKGNLLYLFGSHVPSKWMPWDSLLAWDYMTHPSAESGEVDLLHQFDELRDQGLSPLQAALELAPKGFIDNAGATIKQSDVPASVQQQMQAYANAHPTFGGITSTLTEAPHFSHGWAVGGSKSGTGESVLVGDPKFQIRDPAYWYEIHVVGETFNARGNTVPGALGFFVGYTRFAAWSHSGGVGDYTDMYRLKMTGNETYEYDGKNYPFECTNDTIKAKNGTSKSARICSTILGPVVTDIIPNENPGEEFVMVTVPIADPGKHTVQGLIQMMRATTLAQFNTGLGNWRTPRTNTIFATSNGDVGYRLTPAAVTRSSLSPLAGQMAQDGSSSSYAWVEFVPPDVRPHVTNPADGFISTGNNLPIGSWYPIVNGGRYSGGDTLRSAQAREKLQEAGANGIITPAETFAVHYDTHSWVFDTLIRAGIHVRDVQSSGDELSNTSLRALIYLEQWRESGGEFHTDESLYAIAHHLSSYFRENTDGLDDLYGGGEPGLVAYARHLRDRLNANPNVVLADSEISYLNYLFEKAWDDTTRTYGDITSQWKSKFNSSEKAGLPVKYFNSLFENYGSLDPSKDTFYGPLQSPRGDLLLSDIGQVFSIFVDFTNVESAQSISPFGISEDPSNINYRDQVTMWLNGQYRAAPLAETEVMKIDQSTKVLKYTP